ncbi:8-demethylnovobiocic acid synthase [Streptomyces lavendulae subsp. lavendulae]|uniref:8-demethylnovobiocic acid synthase n=1 Tax=Streptomyces lavendulae subsp. lavendulae TaxID=58340 RepID=A0A2K8PP65_STRLA|nr:AMP-binding protein [Streptomyces lavendulae]ATZ28258.1 8-demethylnovobiocic acid synthase [Streptomyces lavendulae subsp. lavendulae]QUQ58086.1 8-demethylnovobiocic acid synthase [Streptomyces lavendulae subsp. lavendulae]
MPGSPRPPYESYVDALLAVLARPDHPPARPVIVAADRTVGARALHAGIHRAARLLAARGVTRGSTVALLTGNHPEALVARYGANLLGARVVHLSPGSPAAARARILESTGAVLLLVDPATRDLPTGTPEPLRLVLDPGLFTDGEPDRHPVTPPAAVRPEDDWCLRFTGGTTGPPKLVRLSHGPYRRMLAGHAAHFPSGASVRFLACTALAHVAGIAADATLLAGGSVVVQEGFDPAGVLAAVERYGVTDLWLLPPLLHELLDHPDLATTDVSALRRLFYGGTPASAARLRRAAEVFGPVLHGSYGQTETGPISEVLPHEHTVTGPGGRVTAGRPLPGVDVEIRDPSGMALPPGSTGEVHVRTPTAMAGYWGRPEPAGAAAVPDGWTATGDLGLLDARGYLHLVDRLKETVIVVGAHLHPAEVEEVLHAHPAVARCAAFGISAADGDEELHVAVVTAAGRAPDAARELGAFVTARLGAAYEPAAIHVMDRLPLTEAGKPDKVLLRSRYGGGADPA